MTPEQFAYWLQGYVEINGDMPTREQWEQITNHLQTVFHKVTPSSPQSPSHLIPLTPTPTGQNPWGTGDDWKDPITGGPRIIC